jgi:hypothetical protein
VVGVVVMAPFEASGMWPSFAQKNRPTPPSGSVSYEGRQPSPVHVSGVVLQRQPAWQELVLHPLSVMASDVANRKQAAIPKRLMRPLRRRLGA